MTATPDPRAASRPLPAANHAGILRGLVLALVVAELLGQAGALPSLVGGGLANLLRLPFLAPSLLGAFCCQLLLRPERRELAASVAVAAALAWPLHSSIAGDAHAWLTTAFAALGSGSLVVLALGAVFARGAARAGVVEALLPAAILPAFVVLAQPMTYLTATLWPTTYDRRLYLADAAFGAPLAFEAGRFVQAVPLLGDLCLAVYVALPLALMLVHAGRVRAGERSNDTLVTFVALTVVGFFGYLAMPVAGPVYAFAGQFPNAAPDPATVDAARSLVLPMPRNCMPSLHSGWALLVWWNARPLGAAARVAAGAFLGVTLLATVGLGFHYAVDLVAAFPLTMAVQAWCTSTRDDALRRRAIAAGFVMTLAWMPFVTWYDGMLAWPAPVLWALALGVVAASSWLERRVDASRAAGSEAALEAPVTGSWRDRAAALALGLVGFAAALHWIILANTLATDLGAAQAMRVPLLVVLAIGAVAGFPLAAALRGAGWASLRAASLGCIVLAVAGAVTTSLLDWAAVSFPEAAAGRPADAIVVEVLRLVFATIVTLPAALAAGCAFATLAEARGAHERCAQRSPGGVPSALALAAGPVALGAAVAAIASAYVVLPSLYSRHLPPFVATLAALLLFVASRGEPAPADEPGSARPSLRSLVMAGSAAFVGGVVLAVESHLFASVVGRTVQSAAQVPFLVGLGLGGGVLASTALLRRGVDATRALAIVWPALALAVVAGLALWNDVPAHFGTYGEYARLHRIASTFAERELVRLCAGVPFLLLPAVLAGSAIGFAAASRPDDGEGAEVAVVTPVLAGLAAAAVVTPLVLVPVVGSRVSLEAAAAAALLLGGVALLDVPSERRSAFAGLAGVAAAALLLVPRTFDVARLASPQGLLFEPVASAPVGAAAEDPAGIVAMSGNGTVAVDGFAASTSGHGNRELPALPLVAERRRALVAGVTPERVRSLLDAGFAGIVIAEPNDALVRLAVDDSAIDEARVHVRDAGPRGVLLVEDAAYDLVVIDAAEVSRRDVASLVTREFYSLVALRLSARGALQQRLDLSRLSTLALTSALASVRSAFPFVQVRFDGREATLVACGPSCDAGSMQAAAGTLEPAAATAPAEADTARGRLGPQDVDRLLVSAADQLGVDVDVIGSTDPDMFLAHQAPRSFVKAKDGALDSLGMLQQFAAAP